MNINMIDAFYRQFVLTTNASFSLPWRVEKIREFNLFFHPKLELSQSSIGEVYLYLLGFIFDSQNPELQNQQVLDRIAQNGSLDNIIQKLDECSGQFVLIYKSNDQLIMLNDACAQAEIYYDASFTSFGSQPKILGQVVDLAEHADGHAAHFFSSPPFLSKKVFAGESTQYANVKHLLPNHLVDIDKKRVARFFPTKPIEPIGIEEASTIACSMLKGFIKAAALRERLALAVTAGYDSRVLFLASLDVDCSYFVSRHRYMSDDHFDIAVPRKLTELLGRSFLVIPDSTNAQKKEMEIKERSIDFPRNLPEAEQDFEGHIYINGNISEIARNYFGNHKNLNHKDLAFLMGYGGLPFVEHEYLKWISSNVDDFKTNGYHPLDMFYWEEKMGNWCAKAKTEWNALGRTMFSPFNSRKLLQVLLSTPKDSRDSHFNKLYNRIIAKLSPKPVGLPINPSLKQSIIKIMKALAVYNLYRFVGIKFRLLMG